MSDSLALEDEHEHEQEVVSLFERAIGVTKAPFKLIQSGQTQFIKFVVGRPAPLYNYALFQVQKELSSSNPYKGAVDTVILEEKKLSFPSSLEADALLTLISPSTREISQGSAFRGFAVPFIPFQNREDHQLAQPATHIVRGRRGVGKSTLIRRAVEILQKTGSVSTVLDMQTYSTLKGEELIIEVLADFCHQIGSKNESADHNELLLIGKNILNGNLKLSRAPPAIKRVIGNFTNASNSHAFIFLDDFHLIDHDSQPKLVHYLHACVKGANGWLKIAGLSSLLNVYSSELRQGLQIPGDAQIISLDLTLENPVAAEDHLKAILENFLKLVGFKLTQSVIPRSAVKRLVWATAGVPRDFLQMFARSVEHARRNKHSSVTLSDVNVAIGEFGQEKMNDLIDDARNDAGKLKNAISKLETVCLDEKKINAFLVKSDASKTTDIVRCLSDLRMVHLIHQSITPDKAGERYDAYIIDYSIFTGFRRRPNVKEMVPTHEQFKVSELRRLPKISLESIA